MLGISTPVPVNEIHIILGLRTVPVRELVWLFEHWYLQCFCKISTKKSKFRKAKLKCLFIF